MQTTRQILPLTKRRTPRRGAWGDAWGWRPILLLAALLGAVVESALPATFDDGRLAYLDRRYDEARRLWLELAQQGDRKAQFGLGTLYHEGAGVDRDSTAASEWFRLAAEQGFAPAQFNLGNAYHRGDGVPQDDGKANHWWREAADQEFAAAQYNLATQYFLGRGVPKDAAIALIYYRRAAENGHPGAPQIVAQLEAQPPAPLAPLAAEPTTPAGRSRGGKPAMSQGVDGATRPESDSARSSEPQVPERGQPLSRTPDITPAGAAGSAAWAWVAAQPSEQYTLQLLTVSSERAALAFIGGRAWRHPVHAIPVHRDGKTRYSVLYGAFADHGAATAAAAELPASLELKPWIRRFRGLQRSGSVSR